MHLICSTAKELNLDLKTWPKQILGSLLLDIALPDLVYYISGLLTSPSKEVR